MNTSLQILKTGRLSVLVQRHDLAIEDDRLVTGTTPSRERLRNLRELIGFVVSKPRPEPHGATTRPDFNDGANAVVFGLVDEVRIGERNVLERGQHWLEHALILGLGIREPISHEGTKNTKALKV
jgi:hypothetical protein